jgi:hypothetical protein
MVTPIADLDCLGNLMKQIVCAAAVAAFAFYALTAPALAQKKSATSLAAIQLECFKSQGGYYDANLKKYVMHGTENDMQSKTDAVNKCVAEKTGKPATPFVQNQSLNQ